MEYYIWIEIIYVNDRKETYKKSFGLEEYINIYEARKAALIFADQKIAEVLNDTDGESCVVEIIASLKPNNEMLIFSKKALSKNNSVFHHGPLTENQIHKNLIRELEIYREENLRCDSAFSPIGGFIVK